MLVYIATLRLPRLRFLLFSCDSAVLMLCLDLATKKLLVRFRRTPWLGLKKKKPTCFETTKTAVNVPRLTSVFLIVLGGWDCFVWLLADSEAKTRR